MPAHIVTRSLRASLFTSLFAVLFSPAALALFAERAPRLEITSPRNGVTTTASRIEVTVSFEALRLPADTIVLTVNGVEAARVSDSIPFTTLEHTFTVDVSTRREGLVVLRARALRTVLTPGKHHSVVVGSDIVYVRIDRDLSNGAWVGPAGGELTSDGGALTLSIPQGALTGGRRISVHPIDLASLPPLADGVVSHRAYELLPHGLHFARPVAVSTAFDPDSDAGANASQLASLRSVADGLTEELDDQTHEVNGNSGVHRATGTLRHFSRLELVIDTHTTWVTIVPDVMELLKVYPVTTHVEDTVTSPLGGGAEYKDMQKLHLDRTQPPEHEVVPLGTLNPSIADLLGPKELSYVCGEPGIAHFYARLTFTAVTTPQSHDHFRRIFCGRAQDKYWEGASQTPAARAAFEVSVEAIPNDKKQSVGRQFKVQLNLTALTDTQGAETRATVWKLTDKVLSDPVPNLPKTRDGQGHEVQVAAFNGRLSTTTITYQCINAGTAWVAFEVTRKLPADRTQVVQVVIDLTCEQSQPDPEPEPNRSPEITSPAPDPSPMPADSPRSYAPVAIDPDGDLTVWELLIQGPGGAWTSTLPEGMEFDPQTGRMDWTPRSDQTGTFRFRLRVSDGNGGEDVLEFTISVAEPPQVPDTTAVPSLTGLPFSEVPMRLAAARLTLGNVGTIVEPMLPAETVVSHSPAANAIVPENTPVDVIISALHGGTSDVIGNEFIINVGTFNLPPGNRVSIAGTNGFVILDAITGEIPTAGISELSFVNQGMGPFFGALVLQDPQRTGGDTIFAFGPAGTAMTTFDTVANQMGMWLVSAQRPLITDAMYFGGDPAAPGALFVNFSAREIYPLVPVDFGPSRGFTWQRPMAERFAFESAPSGPVSAFAWDLQFNSDASLSPSSPGRVLVVTDGSPGRIYLLNPATPSTPGVDLGTAGNAPRQVRCVPSLQLCAISNFESDSLTVARWDGRTTASVVGTVPAGDGPVGIDIVADGPNAKVISTGFNDNTYTVTRLTAEGALLSSETQAAPSDCVNPGHATWLRNSPGSAVLSCKTSNSFSVVTP